MPSVDIVIPCYNYAHLLPQCVQSVLDQGIEELRIVVIDNASTDNSVEMAQRLAAKDRRIEVVCHERNLGPHASFNEGIDLARADYFMILCADDLLVPGALKCGIEALEHDKGAVFAVGVDSGKWVGDTPRGTVEEREDWYLQTGDEYIEECCRALGDNAGAHAILARTSSQKAAGRYRASLVHMDDLEMVLRLACIGSVVRFRSVLAWRRLHGANLQAPLWEGDRLGDLREREAVFDSFFRHEGRKVRRSAELHRIANKRIAETAYWSALSHLYRGRASAGLALMKYGLRLNPSLALIPPFMHLFRTNGALGRILEVISGRA